ncbi:MAG: Ig-like domain-containing protein [Treponema sp.]|jgi:hypothetical protein|nr:Ig-like domain-containing protein [Treponema sp.]
MSSRIDKGGGYTGVPARKSRKGRVLFVLFFALVSCTDGGLGFSGDLLRDSVFEVSKWSPGGGYYADSSAISVSLSFSHVPDRASVERYFSLTADGKHLSGAFRWDGGLMRFIPDALLEINRDYVLSVRADAHDERGLSMDKGFEGRFTTRPDNTRPALISVLPAMNSTVKDLNTDVCLVFSGPITLNSLRDHVSFDPSINGLWRLEEDGTAAVFSPATPWDYGKRYVLRISASFEDSNGMTIGNDFSSVFTIGTDTDKPYLTGVWRITAKKDDKRLSGTVDNSGWEKDDRLRFRFSEPVDTLSVKNCLSAEGAPLLRMETMPGLYDEAVFSFESPPAHESRFSFRLKAGVKDSAGNESVDEYAFKIYADGGQSKPPALVGIRIPMAPDSETDKELTSYEIDSLFEDIPINAASALDNGKDRYPYNEKTETWIECYFETAPGLSVDTLSLMALFHIETSNNVLVFSPRLIKESGFSVSDSRPGWEQYQRLEIRGFLTNTINSGVVNIHVDSGLQDSGGNRNEKKFRISLLK